MAGFVPADFLIPARLETGEFVIRMLAITDVVKDYDAVMSSADHLQGIFGDGSTWPHGLSFEQDLIDLGWHHKEFQRRSSFAYTVMSPDESQCLGCLYIVPTVLPGYEAEAFCWIRASHAARLDERLYETLRGWIDAQWPFKAVAYPGRAMSWETFAALGARDR